MVSVADCKVVEGDQFFIRLCKPVNPPLVVHVCMYCLVHVLSANITGNLLVNTGTSTYTDVS